MIVIVYLEIEIRFIIKRLCYLSSFFQVHHFYAKNYTKVASNHENKLNRVNPKNEFEFEAYKFMSVRK